MKNTENKTKDKSVSKGRFLKLMNQLERTEESARRIEERALRNRGRWEKLIGEMRGDEAKWEAYCKANGMYPEYNFGDMIC